MCVPCVSGREAGVVENQLQLRRRATTATSDGRGATDGRPLPTLRRRLTRRRQRLVHGHRRDPVPSDARSEAGQLRHRDVMPISVQ